MKYLRDATWEDVFDGWRKREGSNPDWIRVATDVKGWKDWDEWRHFTANHLRLPARAWQIFQFTQPSEEIPRMLLGPYTGWQSRVANKHETTFEDLLADPQQKKEWESNAGMMELIKHLPFATQMIGFLRDDGRITCLEGHHRSLAITFAKQQGREIDFSKTPFTIALAALPEAEAPLLDRVLARGSSKNPPGVLPV